MTNVRFNHEDRLMVWGVKIPNECVMADEMDSKSGKTVTLVCE